ncbi:four helix bundle protein [Flavobacterium sp. WC2421]|uniref:four helix bundle protein n=1 Tax=Flavobacterium sp. WC2421 TaxID=3234138 RepID=UPI0034650DE1
MDHKDLDVWKRSMDLVVKVYQITKLFPDTEKYGLTSQMRRASVSIPSNIAEGAARKGDKEFIQFLYISIGSLSELETQYLIAIRLEFITKEDTFELQLMEVKKLLIGFKNYLNKKL